MSGRTFVVILFFWAALTIVTPALVRLSASAKPYLESHDERGEGKNTTRTVLELLPRRALVPTRLLHAPASPMSPEPQPAPAPAPAPAPSPAPTPEPLLELKSLQIL